MSRKLTYVVFLFLLFVIPLSMEFQISSFLGTDLPDEPIMWMLTPIVLIMMIRYRKTSAALYTSSILLFLFFSLTWWVITLIFSTAPLLSLKYILAKIWYIIPFTIGSFYFLNDKRSMLKGAKGIVLSLLFTVFIILIRHSMLGFSFDGIKTIMFPFYRNHVNYGALLVCLIPVAIGLYKVSSKYWAIAVLILLVGLVFTYSRGAWLALIIAGITAWLIKQKKLQWALAVFVMITVSAAWWLLHDNHYLTYRPNYEQTIYHANLEDHLSATYGFKDMSTVERFYRWIAAAHMIHDHWLTGYGPNSFYPTYKKYTVTSFQTYVSDNPEHSTVHNYFILLWVEQGLPGFLLFSLMYGYMLWLSQRLYHQLEDRFYKGVALILGSILSMIGVLNMLSDLIETDKIGSVFYICAGLLIVLQSKSSIVSHPTHRAAHFPTY